MKTWWNARTRRESNLILVSGIVIAAFVLFQGVAVPLSAFYASARQTHDEALTYLVDVEQTARLVRELRASAQTRVAFGEGGLRAAASAIAQESGAAISRMQPLADGAIEFSFDSVNSQQVYRWLSALSDRHGVQVLKVNMQRTGGSELVRAQVALAPIQTP